MRFLFFIFCFVAMHVSGYGQQRQLSGKVTGETGKPVAHIAVLLKNGESRILAFAYTDVNGYYRIPVADTMDLYNAGVEISNLQYHVSKQLLQPDKDVYDFNLSDKVISLPEVKAMNRPVTRVGDTTAYNVNFFARDEDRNIGEVIARLPGLSIGEDGMIYFNDKPISDLYIDGDNLMAGRYQIATKAINKNMIKSIEVIQHHQAVKVLKDRVMSDNVVINLVLKDENSTHLSGQAMLGAGLPAQWEGVANTMMFNRKFKMLNTLKGNNSGVDYSGESTQFGAASILETEGNTRPSPLLSAGTVGDPDIPRSNYFINRSGAATANILFNTKNEWQWRLNFLGHLDRNKLAYTGFVENYFQNDTIRYSEIQNAIRKKNAISTVLSVRANRTKYLFDNVLRVNFNKDRNNSQMDLNGLGFGQQLRGNVTDITNTLAWIPASRKGVWGFNWYVNYYNSPQTLAVDEGLNADVLNEGKTFNGILQTASIPTWFSHASITYRPSKSTVNAALQAGLMNEQQDLNSLLLLQQVNNVFTEYTHDPGNALGWRRSRIYLNSSYYLTKKNWQVSLSVPANWQSIRYMQQEYKLDEGINRFFVNPTAKLKVSVAAEDHIELSLNHTNNLGNIAGVYRGAILSSYRNLQANDAELQERSSSGAKLNYHFQRSITMFFLNGEVKYNRVKANSILSGIITDNVQRTILLPYENDQSSFSAYGGGSKYIFSLKTKVSMGLLFQKNWYDQFLNGERLPFVNNTIQLTGGMDAKFWNRLTFAYNGFAVWSDSRLSSKSSQGSPLASKALRLTQRVTLGYSPVKSLFLTVKGWETYNQRPGLRNIHYVFVDANLRYKMVKWKTDFEMDLTNLGNIRRYEYFSLLSNRFAANSFNIRGRMAMLKATFFF
ncbi:carboxypeptidase-like regulatory domain-containing protein [Terrimonas sp. NA20]|uniref:Carboxypeptidase-like regulatory domain-containing protein n=1 Tax=Terrimonas ginsenosidimutans TaxID=2908004 RepID=A0ABS9KNZ7_9BACT|nr:carboxypeptidase-like regulatory domain-containing protein [Terrimonas ginsenosidimutans]MCG2614057.1 carboxypeptidase-like regulatory domain-containing protein [Terrimonas ginsenosidimutans]